MKAICHSFQLLSKIHFPPEKQMIAILFQLVVSAIHSQFVLTRRKEPKTDNNFKYNFSTDVYHETTLTTYFACLNGNANRRTGISESNFAG